MRLSIKSHNTAYIEQLALNLGCSTAEALNFLILKIKSEGITASIPTASIGFEVASSTPSNQSYNGVSTNLQPSSSTPLKEGFESFNRALDTQHLQETIDPIIQKLIDAGVCSEGF